MGKGDGKGECCDEESQMLSVEGRQAKGAAIAVIIFEGLAFFVFSPTVLFVSLLNSLFNRLAFLSWRHLSDRKHSHGKSCDVMNYYKL